MNLNTHPLGEPGKDWRLASKKARPDAVCVGCLAPVPAASYRLVDPRGPVQRIFRICEPCYAEIENQDAWTR